MNRKKWSIKFTISASFISLITVLALFLLLYNYKISRDNARNLLDIITSEVTKNAIDETNAYFHRADSSLKVLTKTNRLNDILRQREILLNVMSEFLKAQKHLSSIFLADGYGSFLQVKREPYVYREVSEVGEGKRIEYVEYKDENYETSKITLSPSAYDPRLREWYKSAKKDELWITKPYKFASDNEVGITISLGGFDEFGSMLAVGAVDIKLSSLARFLRKQAKKSDSQIVIYDAESYEFFISSSDELNSLYAGKGLKIDDIDDTSAIIIGAKKSIEESEKGLFSKDGEEFLISSQSFEINKNLALTIVVITPEEVFLGDVKRSFLYSIAGSLMIFLLFVYISLRIANLISKPIVKITGDIGRLQRLDLGIATQVDSNIVEIYDAQNALNSLKNGIESFSKYMPLNLVRTLIDSGVKAKIGGEEREIAIMFTDIEDFTAISEGVSPSLLTSWLAIYFEAIEGVISKYEGTIDKYIGDAVMAFWGAPLEVSDPAKKALECAIEIQKELKKINDALSKEGKKRLETRIGLHYGKTLVGNIGSNSRMNYTIIGDSVNVASRLESINKEYGTKIMFSEQINESVKDSFATRYVDERALKGKSEKTRIYTVDF